MMRHADWYERNLREIERRIAKLVRCDRLAELKRFRTGHKPPIHLGPLPRQRVKITRKRKGPSR